MNPKIIFTIALVFAVGFMSVLGVQAQDSCFETLANTESYESNPIEKSSAFLKEMKAVSEKKFDAGKNAYSADEGVWLKDPITGCGVWNSKPKGNETISWSGECHDGKASGSGVLLWLEDGKIVGRFKGTMANGKAEGRGKLDFEVEDGFAHYDGDFRNSEMHGRGLMVFPDKSSAEGDFEHDKMNGAIKATIADGGSYEGEIKDNLPHGKGRQITPSGEEYYGEFADGKREGKGTLLLPNGDIYKGQFKDEMAEGIGTLSTAEGEVYEGSFHAGEPHGEGVFTTSEGDVARGRFVKGEPEGKIVFTLKNGETRNEIWKNGKKVQQ